MLRIRSTGSIPLCGPESGVHIRAWGTRSDVLAGQSRSPSLIVYKLTLTITITLGSVDGQPQIDY